MSAKAFCVLAEAEPLYDSSDQLQMFSFMKLHENEWVLQRRKKVLAINSKLLAATEYRADGAGNGGKANPG